MWCEQMMPKKKSGWQMSENLQIHATMVEINGKGVLLKGKSGSGKSDLALRLITDFKARLVADDVVDLSLQNGKIYGSVPHNLQGLLEVRGVGIIKMPFCAQTPLELVVDLVADVAQIERMPKDAHENILGLEIAKIDLYAKECSAPAKVIVKLNGEVVNDEAI